MNISGLQYNLNRRTLEIYVSGCRGQCDGCHNPDLWDFEYGREYNFYIPKIQKKIKSGMVDEVWLLGGDPIDQDKTDLINLLDNINYLPLFLWTRYDINEIDKDIKKYFKYIKTGRYDKNLPEYYNKEFDITLASNNQKIYVCR